MIRESARIGLALSAVLLAACQTQPGRMIAGRMGGVPAPATIEPASSPMDGNWAATDGVFVASFQGGNFISRFTKTNEVLAQGSYRVEGSRVAMDWLSVATQQQRSASCTMTGANSVHCEQAGGGGFDLRRAV
jgi:hypothetical protein